MEVKRRIGVLTGSGSVSEREAIVRANAGGSSSRRNRSGDLSRIQQVMNAATPRDDSPDGRGPNSPKHDRVDNSGKLWKE